MTTSLLLGAEQGRSAWDTSEMRERLAIAVLVGAQAVEAAIGIALIYRCVGQALGDSTMRGKM